MKCFADERDVCHNPIMCKEIGKCVYFGDFPVDVNAGVPLDTIVFVKDGKEVGRIENINMKTACKRYPGLCIDINSDSCAITENMPCMRELQFNKDIKEGRIGGAISSPETEIPIHHFESGASSSGHMPPYECLTLTLLKRAALRMQHGMNSYGKHNWKKGAKDKQFILDRLNHAIEHLIRAAHEIDSDVVMTDDDLAAVVVNCMFAMEYQDTISVGRAKPNP